MSRGRRASYVFLTPRGSLALQLVGGGLAQRSSQAAKDVKDLITNSNRRVKDGDSSNRVGAGLSEIVESINRVAASGTATASVEQSTGIEQINKALSQVDEVTQQNSALVGENAATAKTLEDQSRAMRERVGVFLIDDAAVADSAVMPKHPAGMRSKLTASATKRPAAAPRKVVGGPARKMQTALATAVNADPDWKKF
jgi:hypothetical protein